MSSVTYMADLYVPDSAGRQQPQGDRLALRFPFALKDAIKGKPEDNVPGLPGARWAPPPQKFWHVPATADSAANVARLITQYDLAATIDEDTRRLIRQAELMDQAQAHKDATDLPEIPGRYCACPDGPVRVDEHGQDTQGKCDRCGEVIESWMHQRQAYHWAYPREGAGLQMAMGTGKTKVAIALADGWGVDRMIIVAPPNVVRVWPAEFAQNSTRPWLVVNHGGLDRQGRRIGVDHGTRAAKMTERLAAAKDGLRQATADRRPFAFVLPYEVFWREPLRTWLLDSAPAGMPGGRWPLAVCDESHRIKSPGGKWSQTAQRLGQRADRRMILTGTFMPHDQLDVYAQMRFQDPGTFGTSYQKFKSRFFAFGGFEGRQYEGFRDDTAEIAFLQALRRTTIVIDDDVLDLPELVDQPPTTFDLDSKARGHYRDLLEDWGTQLGDQDTDRLESANVLSQMTRLAQVTSGHLPLDADGTGQNIEIVTIGDEKARAFAALLDDIPPAEPVVVFCRFRHDLDRIQQAAAAGRSYAELSGRSKDALTPDAKLREGVQVAGVQLQAGGVGINLTRARYGVYYSLDFNLGDFDQSRKRMHRPGQRRSTFYYYLVARGTIDEVILHALRTRSDVNRAVVEAVKTGDFGTAR